MRAPGATIYALDDAGIHATTWDDLEVVGLWRYFLEAPERVLDVLLSDDDTDDDEDETATDERVARR